MASTQPGFRFPNRWSAALILLLGSFLFIIVRFNLWPYIGVRHLAPPFLDTYAVLSAADAQLAGYDAFHENPYDVLHRVHVYPRIWLWTGYSGLTRNHATIVGAFLGATFLLLAVWVLNPKNLNEFFVSAMLLLSPAVMLSVERGNNDLFVFVLLAMAGLFLRGRRIVLTFSAYLLMLLAGVLKFYPAVALLVFVRHIKTTRVWVIFFATTAVFFGGYAWLTLDDIILLNQTAPHPYSGSTFGGQLLFRWLYLRWPVNRLIYLLVTTLVFFMAYLMSLKVRIIDRGRMPTKGNETFFLMGALCLIFCFFVTTNYDYRNVFFIFTLPFFFENLRSRTTPQSTRRIIRLFFLLLVVIVWNECFLSLTAAALRFFGMHYLGGPISYFLLVVEHFSTWVAVTILLVWTIALLKVPILEKFSGTRSLKKHA